MWNITTNMYVYVLEEINNNHSFQKNRIAALYLFTVILGGMVSKNMNIFHN